MQTKSMVNSFTLAGGRVRREQETKSDPQRLCSGLRINSSSRSKIQRVRLPSQNNDLFLATEDPVLHAQEGRLSRLVAQQLTNRSLKGTIVMMIMSSPALLMEIGEGIRKFGLLRVACTGAQP